MNTHQNTKNTTTPLDPAKVKAGDTVTLTRGGWTVTDVVDRWYHGAGKIWYRFRFAAWHDAHYDMPIGNEYWTLTDHQPAPEPEIEWKPGQFGWANAPAPHGRVHGFLTDRNFVYLVDVPEQDETTGYNVTSDFSNFVADVVIDPAAARTDIAQGLAALPGLTTWTTPGGKLTNRSLNLIADSIARTLGIEAS